MSTAYPPVPPLELFGTPRRRVSLHDVFTLYGQRFRAWFGITAPTSICAAVVLYLADQKIREIWTHIPVSQMSLHLAEMAEAGALRYGRFFLTWLLGCFALGAVAAAIGEQNLEESTAWHYDTHERARENFGPLLKVALFTFIMFLLGMAAVLFVEMSVFRVVGRSHFARFNYPIVLAGYVATASIVAWFGMAIPLILRGNITAWKAIKKSMRLSNATKSSFSS